LLPLFGKFGTHPHKRRWQDGEPASYDPWWWPVDPASTPAHWGLSEEMSEEFWSLCEVPTKGKAFPGFTGSLGAQAGCVLILGERPSFSQSYARAVSRLHKRILLVAQIPELAGTAQRAGFHVSDLIKIRGDGLRDGLTPEMLQLSLECLNEELKTLQPVLVLTTDMALNAMQVALADFGIDKTLLSPLLAHPCLVPVPHWCNKPPPAEWQDRVRRHLQECARHLPECVRHQGSSRGASV
jgi:hypothetical protein